MGKKSKKKASKGSKTKNNVFLRQGLLKSKNPGKKSKKPIQSLHERMLNRLKSSSFRFLNEQIYTSESINSQEYFQKHPEAFKAYHDGYQKQLSRWPINPLEEITKAIKSKPADLIVADFGCGDAKLAQSLPNKVHSFDLVAANERVTACDMSNTPLTKESVDIAVFCLSLMGTNLSKYIVEANRVLREGGILMIAEVESRFDSVDNFINGLKKLGFVNVHKDLSHDLFYFLNFKKVKNVRKDSLHPNLTLNPCLFKKR